MQALDATLCFKSKPCQTPRLNYGIGITSMFGAWQRMNNPKHLENGWRINKMDNNYIKHEVIAEMESLLKCFREKYAVLDALDRDTASPGAYDLVDQLTTMRSAAGIIKEALDRAGKVVPYEED